MISPELFLQGKAAEAVKALWDTEVALSSLQVSKTRKEFEGDVTLVTFPLARVSHAAPDVTAQKIGDYLVENVPEIASVNVVKGFLNVCLAPSWWLSIFSAIASDP